MMRSRRFLALLLVALVVVVFAACGDDDDDSASTATTAKATTTTVDEAAAKAEIDAAFVKFFNGADTDAAGKLALLENGEKLKPTYDQAFGSNPTAKGSTTKVTSVDVLSKTECDQAGVAYPCALVVHDLLVNGQPALAGQKSYAVQVDGKWQVSQLSFCAFTGLGGVTCPS